MRNLFSKPMGALGAPIGAPDRRFSGAGILAGAGIIGSLLDWGIQAETNSSNEWIADQTNWYNNKINKDQLAWARENYDLEKEENRYLVDQAYFRSLADRENERDYNSYKNVIARMREAGINPSLALNSGAVGHASGSGSTVNSVGSPARHNQPGMIPMQTGSPMQAFNGFGKGISDAVGNAIGLMNAETNRQAIENDITVKLNQQELDFLELQRKSAHDADQRKFWESQMEDANKRIKLEQDRFEEYRAYNQFEKDYKARLADQKDIELMIQQQLANSSIRLNSASIGELAQRVSMMKQQVFEMAQNGASQRQIDGFIARQQSATANMLERQDQRQGRQNLKGIRQEYLDFTDWMFQPIKGIVSVGVR